MQAVLAACISQREANLLQMLPFPAELPLCSNWRVSSVLQDQDWAGLGWAGLGWAGWLSERDDK